jgi:hypothetical protein
VFSRSAAAPSRNVASTLTGSAPPPLARAASSVPTRASLFSSNCLIAPLPVLMLSTGMASVSRIALTATTETTGRCMTARVHRCQKVSRSGRVDPRRRRFRHTDRPPRRTDQATPPASTRWPRSRISAGSRVVATRIAIATTIIAPRAIERRAWFWTIHNPASDVITASPEKVTATPEVASASARAAAAPFPARTDSRNRARMNRE